MKAETDTEIKNRYKTPVRKPPLACVLSMHMTVHGNIPHPYLPLYIEALGGIFYEIDPTFPLYATTAGMAFATLWAYLKIKDPKELYE